MRVLISFLWTSAWLVSQFTRAAELPVLDSRCPPYEDAFNPTHLPFANDCTKFYKCSGGFAFPMTCPLNLHWSVRMNRCEYPSVAGCDTSIAGTIPAERNDGVPMPGCPSAEDPSNPTQLAFPGDCGKFYKCAGGLGYPVSCPQGLHWSTALNRCDWPDVAHCVSGGIVTPSTPTAAPTPTRAPTPAPTPAPTAAPTSSPNVRCPLVGDVNNPVQLPYPGDCGKFYKCEAGVAYPINCPQGLHWSTVLNRCDWPSVANCVSGPVTHTPTTSTPTRRPSTSVPTPSTPAPTPSTPTPTPSTPAPTPSTPTPTPSVPNVSDLDAYCSSLSSNRRGYYPYPGDCNRFIQCSNGRGYVKNCVSGLFFNSILLTCARTCA